MIKKTVFFFSLISFPFFMNAQNVNGILLSELDTEYIEIRLHSNIRNRVAFIVDYGQKIKPLKIKNELLKDESGEAIYFDSKIDGFNFLDKHGFELITAVAKGSEGITFSKYIFKRKKD